MVVNSMAGRTSATSERRTHSAHDTSKNKRVLIYGINYAPEPIGVGRYTGELGAYLSQRDIDVDVVTAVPHYPGWSPRDGYSNRYVKEVINTVRVVRCPLLLKNDMRGIWRLLAPISFALTSAPVAAWKILTRRPTAVFCVEPTLLSAPIALLCAKLVGARTILHVQDLEIDAAFAVGHLSGGVWEKAARAYECTLLSLFDTVVTISTRMRDRLSAKGVSDDRLEIVRNWVDLEHIKPLSDRSVFRTELGLDDSAFVVLYSGNIGSKQALHVVLEVASRLSENKALVFVIAGDGPEKVNLMRTFGHLSNVRFLPLQPEDRLCQLLNLANAHVLPQLAGTADLVLPSKLGGMLASGKLCIVMADQHTELHDFLDGAAVLVPAGDAGALCDALLSACAGTSPDIAQRQRHVVLTLTAEKNLHELSRILLGEQHIAELVS